MIGKTPRKKTRLERFVMNCFPVYEIQDISYI